ncbi:MAG: response regulator [Alcanivorax sp.]
MGNTNNTINILIAEDNVISRELMASILKTHGFGIIPASDGDEAIKAIQEQHADLALVDLNMEPKGGFEFIKHLMANAIDLPVIIITADDSSDILTRANDLGVTRVLQKPVEPDRLVGITKNVLKRYGHNLSFISPQVYQTHYNPEQLMQRAVDLAERNAQSKKGGPFGAIVSDNNGAVLGEGVNGMASRIDPTAHAEIMAIRQAAEKLGKADLSECILYCSSEPTMMGQALIESVGIQQVYYGLTHDEINEVKPELNTQKQKAQYTQIGHDHAETMLKRWKKSRDSV